MADPFIPEVAFSNSPLADDYRAYYNTIGKQTGLNDLLERRAQKILQQFGEFSRLVADDSQDKWFDKNYPELSTRINELTELTGKLTRDRFQEHLTKKLDAAGAPLKVIANLEGNSMTLSEKEMQVAHDILKADNPLKVHELSDAVEGVSVKDIQNAIKDHAILQNSR